MAVTLALVAGACSRGGVPTPTATTNSTSTSSTTTTTAVPAEPIVADLGARTVTPAEVDGWSLRFCEGEAPMVCVARGGGRPGTLELTSFPLESFPALQGRESRHALETIAGDAVRSAVEDRKQGCGADYLVEADPSVPQDVIGTDGLRYGWTATRGGEVVERSVTYAAVVDGTVHLLGTAALGEGGCLERIGEFEVDDLDAALPVLDRVAAGFRLAKR